MHGWVELSVEGNYVRFSVCVERVREVVIMTQCMMHVGLTGSG